MTRDDIRNTLILVAYQIDLLTIRIILGTASGVWAIFMLSDPRAFHRPSWAFLAAVSTETIWALLFLLHFLGTVWRFVDPISRYWWNQAINLYGAFLWLFSTLALNIAVGSASSSTALEWVMIAFQAFVILMTGRKKEAVTL